MTRLPVPSEWANRVTGRSLRGLLVLAALLLVSLPLSACGEHRRAALQVTPRALEASEPAVWQNLAQRPSQVTPCSDPEVYRVDSQSLPPLLPKLPACSVVILEPGHYGEIMPVELDGLTLRCAVPALRRGHPNPYGCSVRTIVPVRIGALIVENMIFNGIATNYGGTEDYGLEIHIVETARISDNVFNGMYNHDISTKENVGLTEVFDNLFVRCARHCVEVGQNGNVVSRPQQSGVMFIRGNRFHDPLLHAVTQRSNSTLLVEGNLFRDVIGRSIQSWPYWQRYDYGQPNGPEPLLLPKAPLRSVITNNFFEGRNRLRFEGRGIADDLVLIHGNRGAFACVRVAIPEGTAAAHARIETAAPPRLDPQSDVTC